MKTTAINDTIFASVINRGRQIADFRFDGGISSVEEVVRHALRKCARRVAGLVTIEIRNSTRGWTERRLLTVAA